MIVVEPSRRPSCEKLLSYDFFQELKVTPATPLSYVHSVQGTSLDAGNIKNNSKNRRASAIDSSLIPKLILNTLIKG
jgi:hypothetical protein